MNENKCKGCGTCCKWIILRLKLDREYIKLARYRNCVYVDGRLCIKMPCMYLGKDNRCKIYKKRPRLCRVGGCWKSPNKNILEKFKNES